MDDLYEPNIKEFEIFYNKIEPYLLLLYMKTFSELTDKQIVKVIPILF